MRTLAIVLSSFLLIASVAPASAQKKKARPLWGVLSAVTSGSLPAAAKVRAWMRGGGEWGAFDPNKALPHALNSGGNTFMHFAARVRLDFLREAVRLGGDCNRRNANGVTPLHVAAAQEALGPGPESLRILLRCGAEPNARDGRGNTPLHGLYEGLETSGFSVFSHLSGARYDILKALLSEAGADPNVRNAKGDTPLMALIRLRSPVFTKLGHASALLRHGADPGARNKAGETPLFEALSMSSNSRYSDYDMKRLIVLLIKHGADPDLRDRRGETPLMRAAKHEDDIVEEMKALLAGGADPCLRDRSGKVALEHALEDSSGYWLLLRAGGYVDRHTGVCERDLFEAKKREKKLNLAGQAKRDIQACLEELKLGPGPADGAFGPRARRAIRAWQAKEGKKGSKAAGYLAEGEPAALLAACRPPAPEPLCKGETGSGCWMEYADKPGCYAWNPYPKTEETVTWSGACADGRASGKGRRVWRYRKEGAWKSSSGEGEFRGGSERGRWTLRHDDGAVSEGAFEDGKRSGVWIERYSSGKVWEGPYAGDKEHGVWALQGSSGFTGSCWRNGKKVDMGACLEKVGDRAMEAAGPAELRRGPGEGYGRKGNLASGEKVKVKAEAGEWALVETAGGVKGFVRKARLKAAAIVTQPRCVFGEDLWSESEIYSLNNKFSQPTLDKELFKRGLLYDDCWQEVANKPGCYIFHGVRVWGRKNSGAYYSAANVPRPSIRWSGKCVNGVVHGKGDVVYDKASSYWGGYLSPFSEPGGKNAVFVNGRRHQRVSITSVSRDHYSTKKRTAEGEWVRGWRQGKWVDTEDYTSGGDYKNQKILTSNYLDDQAHGRQYRWEYSSGSTGTRTQCDIYIYRHGKHHSNEFRFRRNVGKSACR